MMRLFITFILVFFSLNTYAATCSAVFPSGAQTYTDSGAVSFFNANDQIINNPSLTLATKTVYHYNGAANTCGSGDCISANVIAEQVNAINFTANSNNINLYNNDELTLLPGNYNELAITHSSKLTLTAGDYYFNHYFNTYENAEIILDGSGVVRIFSNNNIGIRTKVNDGGDATQLLLFSTKEISLFEGSSTNAFLVSKEDSFIKSTLTGAVNAKNVYFFDGTLNYESNEPDFGDYCENSNLVLNPEPIAEWRMEEGYWSNVAFEVIDEKGSFNARAKNGTESSSVFSAITGDPGTCGYAIFDGNNDYIEVPNTFDNHQGSFTITAWIKPANLDSGSRIFIDDENNTSGYGFSLSDASDGSGHLRFYSRAVNPVIVDTDLGVINSNTWTFVAAVHNSVNKTREIYINGVAQSLNGGASAHQYTGNWGVDTGIATIGGEPDSGETNNRFTGNIDEVRFYDEPLTSAEIMTIYGETHACNPEPSIHHYQIVHHNNSLTCESATVTIKACTNSDESSCTESTTAVTVDLFIDGSSDVTKTNIGFTGSTNVAFNYTTPGQVNLLITDASVSATDDLFCSDNSYNDSNCTMTFSDTGFRFLSDGSEGINHQISGKSSDIGYNAANIVIQAIEKNNASGACQGVVINQNIEFAAQCTNPAACTSALAVDDVDIPTSSASPSSYQAIDVGFNGSDTAEIVLNYPDAGVLFLYARYNIPVNGSPSGSYMIGESSFTVRPFGFDVAVAGNPKAEDANGDEFIAAGEEFAVTLTAKQWQAADDTNNDGIPDDGADLSNNNNVANFSGESAVLTHSLVKPVGGVIGTLTDSNFDNFANSSQTKNLSWNEVGIVRFDVNLSDNDYLGAGDVQGNLPFIGRFTPAHYKQTVQEHGVLAGECGAWAYAGQKDAATQLSGAIRYSLQPELIITAYASNGLDITKNFTLGDGTAAEDFNKLSVASIVLADGVNDDGVINDKNQPGKSGDLVTLSANWATATLTEHDSEQGKLRYTFSDLDHYTYLKNANNEIAPFSAEIPLMVESITDSDGITQGADASDLAEAIATGVEIKFGRLLVKNSYGPETSPQSIPMQIEYLADSGKYTVNSEDNCTVVATNNSEMQITDINLGGATPTITQTSQAVSEGLVDFLQLTPQSTNRGKVRLNYQIYPWLGYDWLNNGDFTTAPEAIATFGLYRGNDRIIQWREINP